MVFAAHQAMTGGIGKSPAWWIHQIVVDGVVVGDIGFHGPPGPELAVEIGYSVVPAWRGRGVASRACALILQQAWQDGADTVVAETDHDNVASQAVLLRNGFQRATRRRLHDQPPGGTMNGLTRQVRLRASADDGADLCAAAPRPGRPDSSPRRRHLPAGHAYAGRTGLDQDHCEWGSSVRSSVGRRGRVELDQLPRLLGAADDPRGFRPRPEHGPLVEACQRYGHYPGRSDRGGFRGAGSCCIEQVVTGKEAFRAWRLLVREFGEPAPGPAREPARRRTACTCRHSPRCGAKVPSWRFLAAGVEQRRSRTLVRTASRAAALERTLTWSYEQADRALRSFPGVGPWTSAEVRQRAHGDPDAWSIGDYHVGRDITYALTGEELDDDACLEILEPYRGHRFRVQMLLSMVGHGGRGADPG